MANNHAKKAAAKICLYAIFELVLFGIDQYTKWLAAVRLRGSEDFTFIKNILSFSYLENPGAAWGVLSGRIPLFVILTCVLIIFIILLMCRLENIMNNGGRKIYLILQIDMAVLLAGAFGNLADRLKNSYVIDFIKTDFIDFPIFNVADCYVTVSMILLIIFLLCFMKEDELDKIFYLKKKIEKEN